MSLLLSWPCLLWVGFVATVTALGIIALLRWSPRIHRGVQFTAATIAGLSLISGIYQSNAWIAAAQRPYFENLRASQAAMLKEQLTIVQGQNCKLAAVHGASTSAVAGTLATDEAQLCKTSENLLAGSDKWQQSESTIPLTDLRPASFETPNLREDAAYLVALAARHNATVATLRNLHAAEEPDGFQVILNAWGPYALTIAFAFGLAAIALPAYPDGIAPPRRTSRWRQRLARVRDWWRGNEPQNPDAQDAGNAASTPTGLVAAEIRRFLASPEPEVLCIKGKWGVGKTFAWRKYLEEALKAGECGLSQYSYVTLFGVNSLDDLRYAVVEGTVGTDHFLSGPTLGTFSALGKQLIAKTRSLAGIGYSLFGKSDVGAAIAKAAFLLVRNQLVCFDDLERAGKGLEARDVLGLASSLKEQRCCKVVLLLNEEQMEDEARKEFDRQLEKVVDASLVFAPTSPEAAAIALPDEDTLSTSLKDRVVKLGIVNIRVIKKIERLAKRTSELLEGNSALVREQAVSAIALAAWSVLQPDSAPSLDYLRAYNTVALRMRRHDNGEQAENDESARWEKHLRDYPFIYADDFDLLIFGGVERGYFDDALVKAAADELDNKIKEDPHNSSFAKAWEAYHGSLVLEDAEVLEGLYEAAMENLPLLSTTDVNSTMKVLKEDGRDQQANELLHAFVRQHAGNKRFFDLSNHPFMMGDEVDPTLREVFKEQHASFVDERDPKEVLTFLIGGNGYNFDDVSLLSSLTPAALIDILETINGRNLVEAIRTLLNLARDPTDEGKKLNENARAALRQIAMRSPLRARRMQQFGITVAPEDVAPAATE